MPTLFPRLISWASLLVLLLGFSSPHGLAAQQTSGTVSRVELGFDQSVPGEQTFIPIALKPGAEANIGKIITEIVFSSNLLSFEEARKGTPLKSIDAEVSTRIKDKVFLNLLRPGLRQFAYKQNPTRCF